MDEQAVSPTDIAIIGMSGRFPRARNIAEFWLVLRDGVEAISFFSDEELGRAGIDPEMLSSPDYVKAGGVLEDVELFDASFFGFNPREAEALDPQQRLFLECSWEALEDAGYDPETYEGHIGVYAGSSVSSYLTNIYSHPDIVETLGDFQITLGNDKDNLTTNVSYKLNLKGPSMAIQTACSTSLVAVCEACQSLLSYQCDMAIAGGVRVSVPQATGYFYQEGGIMSPDGHCRAFDAEARGTIGGNGVGVVLMKRMEEAVNDGDHIYAVIKGSAVNNDGSLKVGYTAPSIEGQAEVIGMAQAIAGVESETITYVETHGTGTDMGDPIEVAALTQAFRQSTERNGFCAIGSVKTNIGHLDSAAGVAGLIKAVLALKHGMIPPSLNFQRPNPKIDFANSPFYVNSRLADWKTNGTPRRAGVSSFGIGGTNAHVVLEEAPDIDVSETSRPEHLLVLSARTRPALETVTTNLVEHLKENPNLNLADVAYTLQVGRRAFNHRRTIVASDTNDAINTLEGADPKRVLTSTRANAERAVVFMFPGQGAQYVNMAREVYEAEPIFREQVDLCSELLFKHLSLDLRRLLYASAERVDEAELQLQQTSLAQPALFVTEYAMAQLWMSWGVQPHAMIGHSIGEYVAAALSGVLSLEDALSLVAARGRLMQSMPAGRMLAVPLSERELQPFLNGELSLAAVNGPSSCVVSGANESIARLEARLISEGLPGRRLHTSHAFHSAMMDPILEEFAEEVKRATLNSPQISYVSNTTGTWITAEAATSPGYWVEHLRRAVRFAEGLETLFTKPDRVLLEVGPGQTLSSLARQHPKRATEQSVLSSLSHRNDPQSDERFILNTLGRLWLSGVEVSWPQVYQHERRRRLPLPTYPFERRRFWVEYQPGAESSEASYQAPLGKMPDIADWFHIPSWKRSAPPELFRRLDFANEKLSWLIFSDECGLGAGLAEALRQTNQDVTSVLVGEQFTERSERIYTIDPGRSDDYRALLQELRSLGQVPQRIVHLWSVTKEEQNESGIERFEKAQEAGFYSLLFLAQAIGDVNIADDVRIEIVSSGMQAVSGEETLLPEKATVLGPCKVIPQEYPNITCRSIDVILPSSATGSFEALIKQLLTEFTAETPGSIAAYRGSHRWVRTFEAVPVDGSAGEETRLRDGGVYLITGGLGGIGLVLAEHLAKTVRARLVLIGRTALPAREEWERWLDSHDEQDDVSRKLRKVLALEESGARVMVVAADVADESAMRDVVRETTEKFGPVNGVIHAAGIAGGRMIQLQSQEIAGGVLSPKAKGALVLESVLKEAKLDFLLLCSSLSSIEAPLGQVDYASANAFLDAFAHRANSGNGNGVVSVNWDTWQEVGMAVNTAVPRDMEGWRAESLSLGIMPDEGAEVFTRILTTTLPQVAVSTTGLEELEEGFDAQRALGQTEDEGEAAMSENAYSRPELETDYVAPRNEVEQSIAAIWQKLLGVEQIGVHDNFFELGGHSLIALQLISRLRDAFQVEVNVQHLFLAPTISELALTVERARGASIEERNKIEETLKFVEQLSDEEIQELLAKEDYTEEQI